MASEVAEDGGGGGGVGTEVAGVPGAAGSPNIPQGYSDVSIVNHEWYRTS